jgi:hypothetical protein
MDERKEWIGARISWRIHVQDPAGTDVEFHGEIDTAEDIGAGNIRMSGELSGGGRFVLVTDHAGLRRHEP